MTSDGFLGLPKIFLGIPFQMCQFHMKKIVTRNVTLKPLTEPGRAILALVQTLTYTDPHLFRDRLRNFHLKYVDFINMKTIHPDGSSSYTHEGVRHSYLALVHWYDYLFTCRSDKNIPNTTNTCDGHFSHIKDVLRIHRGLNRSFKQKVINSILIQNTIAPKNI